MDYVGRDRYRQTYVVKEHRMELIESSLEHYLNRLLQQRLSGLEASLQATKVLFGYKSLVPILIDEKTLLFPIFGLRGQISLLVNYHQIQTWTKHENHGAILSFESGHAIHAPSHTAVKKQIRKCEEILHYLQEAKID
ncbi:MAG: competence protein ComK [Candidatus Izemoplasmatales bacterium]|nr:competence protein ComK [Candidatus Izemoplasmatales bacterium]